MKGDIKMKKILFAIAIVMMLGMTANAQRDGFFRDYDDNVNRENDGLPKILGGELGGLNGDQDAPLGTGLLVLTALGAGYAVARRRK